MFRTKDVLKMQSLGDGILIKTRAENPRDWFTQILKILNMGSISSKEHDLENIVFSAQLKESLPDLMGSYVIE